MLLQINKFAYNNITNATTSYTIFKLKYKYHPQVLFEKDINPYFRFFLANKLTDKLRKLIEIYCQNLFHIQKLQKRVYNQE